MSVSSFFCFQVSGGNDAGGNGMPNVIRYERFGTVVQ
jgi:hypothetical protein